VPGRWWLHGRLAAARYRMADVATGARRRGAQLRADRRAAQAPGRDYSHATGEFYGKAVAIKGGRERIGFLVRGLKWAIREFEQALPRIADPEVKKLFAGMRERHARSAAACESVALPQ